MRRDESKFASPLVQRSATELGGAIRAARLARNSTQSAMAERARMSAITWMRIEGGEVGVAFGLWLSAMEHTGLLPALDALLRPEADPVGERLRKAQARQRARVGPAANGDFDF